MLPMSPMRSGTGNAGDTSCWSRTRPPRAPKAPAEAAGGKLVSSACNQIPGKLAAYFARLIQWFRRSAALVEDLRARRTCRMRIK